MSDYIRRQDAINVAQNYHCSHDITIIPNTEYSRGFYDGLAIRENDILQGLSELKPSADVAPVVHSRWIKTADGAECENCGREAVYQVVNDHWEYEPWCPHCGAIMDNKRGNENDQ